MKRGDPQQIAALEHALLDGPYLHDDCRTCLNAAIYATLEHFHARGELELNVRTGKRGVLDRE